MVICLIVALIVAWSPIPAASGAREGSADRPRSAAETELVRVYEILRATPQQNPWKMNAQPSLSTLVPRATRTVLQQLKRSLLDVVSELVTHNGTGALSAEEIRSRVILRLGELGIKISPPEDTEATAEDSDSEQATEESDVRFPYGDIGEIKLATTPDHPDYVVLAPIVKTGAGADMPIYLFYRPDGTWQLLMADHDTGEYDEISSDHDLALSPPDAKGNCFVVAIKLTGGLHSSLGSLSYRALRASRDPRSSKTLARGTRSARRMFDPPEIRTQSDGFELEFIASALDRKGQFDPDTITATRLLRFKVDADRAKIVARKQIDPEEFDIPASADE
jgi:hypothetical protein